MAILAPTLNFVRAEELQGDPLPPRALLRIGTNNLRTRGSIRQLAFSPDGQRIAAAETHNPASKVSLFDIKTGRPVKRINVADPTILGAWCFAFSPDGTRLAWGELDGHLVLWDLAGDRLLRRGKLHAQTVNAVAFSPDGRMIASGSGDGVVHLRSVRDLASDAGIGGGGPKPASFPADRDVIEPGSRINSLAFTPDGTRLIVGASADVWASISIWRVADGQRLRKIERAHGAYDNRMNANPVCLAVTPDGHRVLSTALANPPAGRIKDGRPGRPLAEIRSWDIETGQRMLDLRDDEDGTGCSGLGLSRDGRRMVATARDSVRVLDAATGRPERTIPLADCGYPSPVLSPDGTVIAAAISNTVYLYELQSGRRLVQDESTPARELEPVAWSPAGDRIATAHGDGIVRIRNGATGELVWRKALVPEAIPQSGSGQVRFVEFSSDGRRVVVVGDRYDRDREHHGVVAIYDAANGVPVHEAEQEGFGEMTFSPDASLMFGDRSDRRTDALILVGIETVTGRELWRTELAKAEVWLRYSVAMTRAVQFRPDLNAVVVAMLDGEMVHYDARSGREQRRVRLDVPVAGGGRGPRDRVSLLTVAFRSDGRMLVSRDRDRICVWDVDTGALRHEIRPPQGYGALSALAPDGRTLATVTGHASQDAIRLYDLRSGKEAIVLHPRDASTRLLRFSSDGTKLFTGFDRGSALVWDVRGEDAPAAKR